MGRFDRAELKPRSCVCIVRQTLLTVALSAELADDLHRGISGFLTVESADSAGTENKYTAIKF